ncbi:MAG: type II toxin-antitoxin system RelB/DinJ family antitoxin [Candidatus Gastranaerophilales bacterium]|nr:type II toxin-antitoxin system RelB/DinJ family antitoxin [Candidatus Gastranaerophilales bacterium]
MSKTIQIRVDDVLKNGADALFSSLGLDTSTAIRMFLTMSVEMGGFPFEIKIPNNSLKEAMKDALEGRNLSRAYKTGREAVESMLED